jgi:hypothetical protein
MRYNVIRGMVFLLSGGLSIRYALTVVPAMASVCSLAHTAICFRQKNVAAMRCKQGRARLRALCLLAHRPDGSLSVLLNHLGRAATDLLTTFAFAPSVLRSPPSDHQGSTRRIP